MEKAIELKKDQPYRSHLAINRFLEEAYTATVPRSTNWSIKRRHYRLGNAIFSSTGPNWGTSNEKGGTASTVTP
jgi:hypothetical protein